MMSQLTLVTFDPAIILPNYPGQAREFHDNENYYNAMGFLANTIRDLESDLSIYRGEDISDTIEEYFSDYCCMHTLEFYQRHTDEMMRKATIMHNLMPAGIFERFDFWEAHPRGIYFSGLLHAIDYR
ncbi:hypothetical protein FDI21_gp037 [Pseudomonas phage Noxifer]|uniref:Uncharacterized protein n=1 Tax=Pseudomonas phage Noxifer TaxID=2006684 RepID=A0A1Y0T115_9CAUD|nr:hypothetical protein FDI21_gp037 [Pseudomonas phage Noxifer]ARV77208.1 hypothetical protein NOXIFER_37 [Pseudomonas phage Noxifer]